VAKGDGGTARQHADVVGTEPPVLEPSETFESFVRRQGGLLRRQAFLLTGDHHAAEDLVQVTLAKVARRWRVVSARGDATAYTRTALTRTAISARRRLRHAEVPFEDSHMTSGDRAGQLADREAVVAALFRLPLRQRAVIVLRFYEDLSVADAARVLQCSPGTVKSQTAKALEKLRPLLAADGGPGSQERSS
jgi:RNA polymerase sigma-70 factor (sigma-E family)